MRQRLVRCRRSAGSVPYRERVAVPAKRDTPESAHAGDRRLPNARYVELAGHGHNLMFEDPETFNALVLDFIA
jgi:pimeloyl-ACP methyl ester carboxylesterase